MNITVHGDLVSKFFCIPINDMGDTGQGSENARVNETLLCSRRTYWLIWEANNRQNFLKGHSDEEEYWEGVKSMWPLQLEREMEPSRWFDLCGDDI